jgi:hypothetical protein
VANANKLNSTVYFFFGVFLGLTALVFFGDLVAFFAGLAAGFFAAAGFLAMLHNYEYSYKKTYREMVGKAIAALKERGGSSRQAILKYIMANFNVGKDPKTVNVHLSLLQPVSWPLVSPLSSQQLVFS